MNKNKLKGIGFIISAAFFFTLMSTFVRLSGDLPSMQKAFFRNLVAAVIAFITLMKDGQGIHIEKKNLIWHFLRSAVGLGGIIGNFYAIDHLVLSNANMLNKMSPFFVLVFSFLVLKEKLKPLQIGAVAVAFIGSMFIIKPTFANVELLPSLAGFAGGMCAGFAYTMVRKLSLNGERGGVTVFFFSTFSCVVLLPVMISVWQPMTLKQLMFLLLAGAAAAGGQFTITAAYSYAPGREISVYDYSQIIFSAVIGFMVFGDIPDGYSFIGYALIITAAIVNSVYTNKLAKVSGQ